MLRYTYYEIEFKIDVWYRSQLDSVCSVVSMTIFISVIQNYIEEDYAIQIMPETK
jgi:hypothetical protein